jgi:hypothetical protein
MHIPRLLAVCAVLPVVLAAPTRADDVVDQVNEGLTAYAKKDYATAITALEAATALLREARSEIWKTYLPPAPPGWTAVETEAGAGTLGMGSSASRKYVRDGENVEISLMTDSPIMQGLASVISNPMIAAAAGKTVVVGGRRINYIRPDNSYLAMVADRVLVRVKGSGGVPEETLRQFLGLVRFAEIEKAAR